MRIYTNIEGSKLPLLIEHNGKLLEWGDFKPYPGWGRGGGDDNDNDIVIGKTMRVESLLIEINNYWASKPDKYQDELFALYTKISKSFLSDKVSVVANTLYPLIRDLLNKYHDLEDISEFMRTQEIRYPDKVYDTFNDNEGRHQENITYTKEQYFGLACLMVAFRAMVPIWTRFRAKTAGVQVKNTMYAQMEQLRLVRESNIAEHRYMHRLIDFVEAVYRTVENSNEISAIVGGVSTTEIPNYLLSSAICTKLIGTAINPSDPKISLVSSIYNKIKADVKHLPDKLNTLVRKRDVNWGNQDDDKTGYFESYAAAEKVASDVIIGNQVYLYDYRRVRRDLDDTIPTSTVVACIESLEKNKELVILGGDHNTPIHQTLVQWVLSGQIMIHTVPKINRRAMINAMGVTQAALIHWGFKSIAMLMSVVVIEDMDHRPNEMLPLTTKERTAIDGIYRYHRQLPTTTRMMSLGRSSVEEFGNKLNERQLELIATDDVKRLISFNENDGRPLVDPSIKSHLSELVLLLARRADKE